MDSLHGCSYLSLSWHCIQPLLPKPSCFFYLRHSSWDFPHLSPLWLAASLRWHLTHNLFLHWTFKILKHARYSVSSGMCHRPNKLSLWTVLTLWLVASHLTADLPQIWVICLVMKTKHKFRYELGFKENPCPSAFKDNILSHLFLLICSVTIKTFICCCVFPCSRVWAQCNHSKKLKRLIYSSLFMWRETNVSSTRKRYFLQKCLWLIDVQSLCLWLAVLVTPLNSLFPSRASGPINIDRNEL